YIQNFSGQRFEIVREVFFDTFRSASQYRLTEILPDRIDDLAIIRIHITDYSIWENEELVATPEDGVLSELKTAEILMRRNALVSARVSLFDGRSGDTIVRKKVTQPFQQIYIGEEEISNRPTKQQEMQRLVRLLAGQITDILTNKKKAISTNLEKGEDFGWIAKNLYDGGNGRLKKGIDYAATGDYDQAILIWKLVLFGPEVNESDDIYLRNRAKAFYNLGVVYNRQKDWWFAAKMYSQANRLQQNLKYAQAWSNSVYSWLEEGTEPEVEKKKRVVQRISEQELLKYTQPAKIDKIEGNIDLLLKPRDLWPLEQKLKFKKEKGIMKSPSQEEIEDSPELKPTELEPLDLKS
ncbi:MAG: tetratricopeptide repeat protein, partial [Proteobacteria bacterium]|nr:tetratricopeptide repeat protein [Pseudomonadota bacterium]